MFQRGEIKSKHIPEQDGGKYSREGAYVVATPKPFLLVKENISSSFIDAFRRDTNSGD